MKTLIIYFTGTYNTKYLVEKIKERFTKESLGEVEFLPIDGTSSSSSLNSYDLIFFSYPIYAFNTPIIFDRFIKRIKLNKNQKVIIAKQSGEPIVLNNSSSYSLIRKIKKDKAKLLSEYHFLMPYNIHFRYEDDFIKELFIYNEKLLDILVYELKNNIVRKVKYNPLLAFNSFVFKIQRLGGPVNSYFYRVDYTKCILCQKCINECPINNITFDNNKKKIIFHHHCLMCMRCSFFCPKDAINIGMLQKWKVNGKYDLSRIDKESLLKGDYLKTHKTKFFKLFPKVILKINSLHDKYFKAS